VRYDPATESVGLTLEAISHACHAAVAARPVPRHQVLAEVWNPQTLGYEVKTLDLPVGCPYRVPSLPF
jgi:hypothetical protein